MKKIKFTIRTWQLGTLETEYNNSHSTYGVKAADQIKAFAIAAKLHLKDYGTPPFKVEWVSSDHPLTIG